VAAVCGGLTRGRFSVGLLDLPYSPVEVSVRRNRCPVPWMRGAFDQSSARVRGNRTGEKEIAPLGIRQVKTRTAKTPAAT
jgi:hypothetical protein